MKLPRRLSKNNNDEEAASIINSDSDSDSSQSFFSNEDAAAIIDASERATSVKSSHSSKVLLSLISDIGDDPMRGELGEAERGDGGNGGNNGSGGGEALNASRTSRTSRASFRSLGSRASRTSRKSVDGKKASRRKSLRSSLLSKGKNVDEEKLQQQQLLQSGKMARRGSRGSMDSSIHSLRSLHEEEVLKSFVGIENMPFYPPEKNGAAGAAAGGAGNARADGDTDRDGAIDDSYSSSDHFSNNPQLKQPTKQPSKLQSLFPKWCQKKRVKYPLMAIAFLILILGGISMATSLVFGTEVGEEHLGGGASSNNDDNNDDNGGMDPLGETVNNGGAHDVNNNNSTNNETTSAILSSIERTFRQTIQVSDSREFSPEEIKMYESQLENYTSKFDYQESTVIVSCTVIHQELLMMNNNEPDGVMRLRLRGDIMNMAPTRQQQQQSQSTQSVFLRVMTFTMKYELMINDDEEGSRPDILQYYPTLFQEYVTWHLEKVTADLQKYLPMVVMVKEVEMVVIEQHEEEELLPSLDDTMNGTYPSLPPSETTIQQHEVSDTPPAIVNVTDNLCVTFQQSNLITDCSSTQTTNHCNPYVALYGNIALVSKHETYIQFLSKQPSATSNNYDAMDIDNEDIDNDAIETSFQMTSHFGASHLQSLSISDMAMYQNYAVVGTPHEDSHSGAIYLFEREKVFGMWNEFGRIVPADLMEAGVEQSAEQAVEFGTAVDLHEDILVVGAPKDAGGSVYIFRRNKSNDNGGWVQEAKLTGKESNTNDSTVEFGTAVSVQGDFIAVGDYLHENDNGSTGAVFLYHYDSLSKSWMQFGSNSPITNNDCTGWFGSSLSLLASNNNHGILIGCPDNGSIYYYTIEEEYGVLLRQKIVTYSHSESGTSQQERLGGEHGQMAVSGNIMIASTKSLTNGRVYIFALEENVWSEIAVIEGCEECSYFGSKVALSGTNILVASKEDVYSYSLDECPSPYASTFEPVLNETIFPTSSDDSSIPTQAPISLTESSNGPMTNIAPPPQMIATNITQNQTGIDSISPSSQPSSIKSSTMVPSLSMQPSFKSTTAQPPSSQQTSSPVAPPVESPKNQTTMPSSNQTVPSSSTSSPSLLFSTPTLAPMTMPGDTIVESTVAPQATSPNQTIVSDTAPPTMQPSTNPVANTTTLLSPAISTFPPTSSQSTSMTSQPTMSNSTQSATLSYQPTSSSTRSTGGTPSPMMASVTQPTATPPSSASLDRPPPTTSSMLQSNNNDTLQNIP